MLISDSYSVEFFHNVLFPEKKKKKDHSLQKKMNSSNNG